MYTGYKNIDPLDLIKDPWTTTKTNCFKTKTKDLWTKTQIN